MLPQVMKKFENIKRVSFDINQSDKHEKDRERLKANKEFLERKKFTDDKRIMMNMFEKEMNKYGNMVDMASTVEYLKNDQAKTALKLNEVGNKFRQFRDRSKKSFADNKKVNKLALKLEEIKNAALDNKESRPYTAQNDIREKEDLAIRDKSREKDTETNKSYETDQVLMAHNPSQQNISQNNDFHGSAIDKEEVAAEVEKQCKNLESKLSESISQNYKELKIIIETDKDDLEATREYFDNELASHILKIDNSKSRIDTSDLVIYNLDKELTEVGNELRNNFED
jgi:hypothetical protein